MTRFLAAFALTGLALTSISAAAELSPGNGHNIHLGRFSGVVYYTVEPDGYRVVATLASGAEDLPIRFISTLGPGQRVIISAPQAVDRPSIDFEIMRHDDALVASDSGSTATTDSDQVAVRPALDPTTP